MRSTEDIHPCNQTCNLDLKIVQKPERSLPMLCLTGSTTNLHVAYQRNSLHLAISYRPLVCTQSVDTGLNVFGGVRSFFMTWFWRPSREMRSWKSKGTIDNPVYVLGQPHRVISCDKQGNWEQGVKLWLYNKQNFSSKHCLKYVDISYNTVPNSSSNNVPQMLNQIIFQARNAWKQRSQYHIQTCCQLQLQPPACACVSKGDSVSKSKTLIFSCAQCRLCLLFYPTLNFYVMGLICGWTVQRDFLLKAFFFFQRQYSYYELIYIYALILQYWSCFLKHTRNHYCSNFDEYWNNSSNGHMSSIPHLNRLNTRPGGPNRRKAFQCERHVVKCYEM